MKCSNCGNELNANDKFCGVCGQAVVNQNVNMVNNQTVAPTMNMNNPIDPAMNQSSMPGPVNVDPFVGQAPVQPMMNNQFGQAPVQPMDNQMNMQQNVNQVSPVQDGMQNMNGPLPQNNTVEFQGPGQASVNLYQNHVGPQANFHYEKKVDPKILAIVALAAIVVIGGVVWFIMSNNSKGSSNNTPQSGNNTNNSGNTNENNNGGNNGGNTTVVDDSAISYAGYSFNIPNGFLHKINDGSLYVVNQEQTIASIITLFNSLSYNTFKSDPSIAEENLKTNGYVVLNHSIKYFNGIEGISYECVKGSQNYLITLVQNPLNSNSVFEVFLLTESNIYDYTTLSTIANMIKNCKNSTSSFAVSEKELFTNDVVDFESAISSFK